MPFTAFDAAPLTTNAGGVSAVLKHELCPIVFATDSFGNAGGTAVNQNHGFVPAAIKKFCTDLGVELLGFEIRAVGNLDVFGEEGGFKSAISGSTPGVANGEVVPGELISGDEWDAVEDARIFGLGELAVRLAQREVATSAFDDATNFIRFTTDDALIGDHLTGDLPLKLRVAFWSEGAAGDTFPFTINPDESNGENNSTAVGSPVEVDPAASAAGLRFAEAPYGGTKDAIFTSNVYSPSVRITGTAADETGKATQIVSFCWYCDVGVTGRTGIIIHTALSGGDAGVTDRAATADAAPSGSSIAPRKGFWTKQAIKDYLGTLPYQPRIVVGTFNENDDRAIDHSVFTGEDQTDYINHFASDGGYRAARIAEITLWREALDELGYDDTIFLVPSTPANPRQSGSFDGNGASVAGNNRYTTMALEDHEAVEDFLAGYSGAAGSVAHINLCRDVGTTYADDPANGTALVKPDLVHPMPAGQEYLWGKFIALIEAAATGPTLSALSLTRDGSDLDVSITTDRRLDLTAFDASVSRPSAADVDIVGGDLTETDNGDLTYTYTATLAGAVGADGTYTLTVTTADDLTGAAALNAGATDDLVIGADPGAPTLSNLAGVELPGVGIRLTFDTDLPISQVDENFTAACSIAGGTSEPPDTVQLSGADIIGEEDNGDGTYTYTLETTQTAGGTYTFVVQHAQSVAGVTMANGSAPQVEFSVTGDETAPTLSSPVVNGVAATTALVAATTTEALGSVFGVVTTSATAPSVAQVKAGQDHTGAAAIAHFSSKLQGLLAVASFGGLTVDTAYYAHLVHTDPAGNDSNVVTTAGFTTAAITVPPGRTRSAWLN